MTPVTFGGCFGWLHAGRGTDGVVLCPALGHEDMTAYRGWRQLAEKLSSRGFHVLRFDYLGSGDSADTEEDLDHVESWSNDIIAATQYLRLVSGSKKVILIGLRFGATLALLNSGKLNCVDSIVALAPINNGKSYIRQLRFQANAWREANLQTFEQQRTSHLEVLGTRLSAATIKSISKININDFQSDLENILFVDVQLQSADLSVLKGLGPKTCKITVIDFVGYAEYLENSINSIIPHGIFKQVVEWCCRVSESYKLVETTRKSKKKKDFVITNISCGLGLSEKAVSFSSKKELFGVLCHSNQATIQNKPSIIMLNTGFGRRIGDGRVFTTLARRLAVLGVTSLRMDLAGFGDSEASGHDINPYAANSLEDVGAAVKLLEKLGYYNPYVIGICSGAFNAFHAAVNDRRIRGVILMNTQMFIWTLGSSLLVENKKQRRPLSFYIRLITRPQAWRRIYHGEVALASILMTLCRRPWTKLLNKLFLGFENLTGFQTSAGQVSRWFDSLVDQGTKVGLIYSEGDPGLEELCLHFGRFGRNLRRLPNTEVHVINNADHALFECSARSRFMDMVVSFIRHHSSEDHNNDI